MQFATIRRTPLLSYSHSYPYSYSYSPNPNHLRRNPHQMLEPEGKAMLKKLTAATGAVGVWGRAKAADGGPGDPDDLSTLQQLVGSS